MLDRASEKQAVQGPPDEPLDIDDGSIGKAIASHNLLVVDCWAPWCGPCRMMSPIIDQLARKHKGRITFGKLNVDHNPDTAAKYQIMSIPALLVFKQGKHVDTIIGAMPAAQVESRLVRYL